MKREKKLKAANARSFIRMRIGTELKEKGYITNLPKN
jgi:hypothetical protein